MSQSVLNGYRQRNCCAVCFGLSEQTANTISDVRDEPKLEFDGKTVSGVKVTQTIGVSTLKGRESEDTTGRRVSGGKVI